MHFTHTMTAPPCSETPALALTMGDVCGIGPEILAKAFVGGHARGAVVVGDAAVMQRALEDCGTAWRAQRVRTLAEGLGAAPEVVPVIEPPGLPAGLVQLPWGRIDARAGAAAAACIRHAVALARGGQAAAIVTAPIHKEALALAGEPYPGHTEMLQDLSGGAPVRMMLANDELKVVLLSTHLSLRAAIEAVTVERIVETLRIAHEAARAWGLDAPRLAVAGLNPHAGEGGLFGDEELRIIAPAVERARALGLQVSGPLAPDTVFMRARHAPCHPGEFDLVVAMYHDQGLIPVKYLGLDQGVNVTLGLPFVRTSPDHGTAFDIAGQGRADPASLVAAIGMARRLARHRSPA